MRAIGLLGSVLVMVTWLLTDAADAASNAWCATYPGKGDQRQLQLCHATTVSGPGVGTRWLLPA
jgi:hypothetical protein